jgi:hypothetical protein
MNERIHAGPLSEAILLEWGYDVEMLLLDQDEDLVLGSAYEFYPVLAKLAMDPACPKADYCLRSIDFNLMFWVLREHPGAAEHIRRTTALFDAYRQNERVIEFHRVNSLRLTLLAHEPVLTLARTTEIGIAALNGISRQCDISVSDQKENWMIELSVPPLRQHKEWLSIVKRTGQYSFRP